MYAFHITFNFTLFRLIGAIQFAAFYYYTKLSQLILDTKIPFFYITLSLSRGGES